MNGNALIRVKVRDSVTPTSRSESRGLRVTHLEEQIMLLFCMQELLRLSGTG